MKPRRAASIIATAALATGIALAVLIAAPSVAAALRTAHLDDGGAAAGPRAIAHPPAPAPSPSVRYRGPLVAPPGWADLTRAQLHAAFFPAGVVVRDRENAEIGERQARIVTTCMADHGFLFDPTGETDRVRLLRPAQRNAFLDAEYGPRDDGAYDWRTAGCHGLAVHLTGQDDLH